MLNPTKEIVSPLRAVLFVTGVLVAIVPLRMIYAAGDSPTATEGIAIGGSVSNSTIQNTVNKQDPAALAAMVKGLTDQNAATTEARVRAEREAAALAEKLKLTTEAFTGLLQTLGNVPSDKIPAKLIEIATQQVATSQHLALFDPGDAATKALVNQAKVALDKGHPAAASALSLRAGNDLTLVMSGLLGAVTGCQ